MAIGNTDIGLGAARSRTGYNTVDWIAWVLVVVGAINWGLVGAFGFDLVAAIFGTMTVPSRVVYILVGLAGLYFLSVPFRQRAP
ncbi:MAG: hypothetical protein JWQ73_2302 [Variovorax sp.]|jgi:uncharacterized membrane protein YuzA (DUF378 family)|nr:hypothetical protein [Variovorax sp.]